MGNTAAGALGGDEFETDVPARLDRLPWSDFHWRVVVALGITWVLNGLEVTLVGSLAAAIKESPSLALSETRIGMSASAYLIGAIAGALGFGWLADRVGRRRLFFVTLLVYMLASVATGLSWDFWSFSLFRLLTGAGVGGEYAAVNSAIQELIPARKRGAIDLAVNGTFWGGAAVGSIISLVALDPRVIDPEVGWRAAFAVGGALSAVVLVLRRYVSESPRWLMAKGRNEEAEAIVGDIEREVAAQRGPLPPVEYGPVRFRRRGPAQVREVWDAMVGTHRRRTVLGLTLVACQAFCYNALGFTYALVLAKFYGVEAARVGWFMLPFALGNLAGPLLLGPLFDTVGRKAMITGTYAVAGVLMAVAGWAFGAGWLTAWQQTAAWTVVFFFASAAASAAYLTVGESFPLEMRATAIALFFAVGTALGGVVGPPLFGALIEGGDRAALAWGYTAAALLLLVAAATEWRLGFAAEGKPLEEVAAPLAALVMGGLGLRVPEFAVPGGAPRTMAVPRPVRVPPTQPIYGPARASDTHRRGGEAPTILYPKLHSILAQLAQFNGAAEGTARTAEGLLRDAREGNRQVAERNRKLAAMLDEMDARGRRW